MKKVLQLIILLLLLTVTGIFGVQANQNGVPQFAATGGYRVTTTTDSNDGTCDSHCTLREAIIAANNDTGINPIVYIPSGTYTLTIAGADEDSALQGDLDITRFMTIIGEGHDTTIIDGNDLDRVFDVHGDSMWNNTSYYFGTPQFMLSDVTVQNGFVSGASGGGIRISSPSTITPDITLMDVTVQNSQASDGGGLIVKNVILRSHRLRLIGNTAMNRGGGLFVDASDTPHVANYFYHSVIRTNTAIYGGGIYLLSNSSSSAFADYTSLLYTELVNNTAQDGGGLYAAGTIYYERYYFTGTISGNQATNNGGGVYNENVPVYIYSATVSNNTADSDNNGSGDGGGLYGGTNATEFDTSIIYGNIDTGGQAHECAPSGAVTATTDSIIGNFAPCSNTAGTGTVTGQDPLLLPLADNGGDTFTHALQAGSPAIGMLSGDNCYIHSVDQRGVPYRRFGTTCEPGAYAYVNGLPAAQIPPVPTINLQLPGTTSEIARLNEISILFNEPMHDVQYSTTDSAEVDNPANYRVLAPGSDGIFQTTTCDAVQDDDTTVPYSVFMERMLFESESNNAIDTMISIMGMDNAPLAPGTYRILICDEITDIDGNAVDGNLDMLPGGDAHFDIEVMPSNLSLFVTTTVDTTDGTCDSHCSLRDAVRVANGNTGQFTIIYVPAGTYTLTLTGTSESNALTGDLDIRQGMAIIGAGRDATIINGNGTDRIFDILNVTNFVIDSVTLENGVTTGTGGAVNGMGYNNGIVRSRLRNNTAASGGALYVASNIPYQPFVYSSEFTGNSATSNGGAIYGIKGFEVHTSAFYDNSAVRGSAIASTSPYLSIYNSTISSNIGAGGAIFYTERLLMYQTTIADNESGVLGDADSEIHVSSSIFANNGTLNCGTHPDFTFTGYYPTGSYNIFDDAGCPFGERNLYNTDPLLEPLADNGGLTQTHALAINSPAQDVFMLHKCVEAVDQRGTYRQADGLCDIGAYEQDSFAPPLAPTNLDGSGAITAAGIKLDLTWDDTNSDETAYVVERSQNNGSSWVQLASLTADTTTYQDTPACGIQYDYRVRAYRSTDGAYSGASNTFTTVAVACTPPVIIDQPTSFNANYLDPITLFVTVESVYANTVYNWYVGESGSVVSNPISSAIGTLNINATQAAYWVRVTNPAGSVNSATMYINYPVAAPVISSISANPNPVAVGSPLSLSADIVAEGNVVIEWSANSITGYIPVGNTSSIVVPASHANSTTQTYRLRVTNEGGRATHWITVDLLPTVVDTCSRRQLTHNDSGDFIPRLNFISRNGSRVLVTYEQEFNYSLRYYTMQLLDTETGAVILSVDDAYIYDWKGINADGSRITFVGRGNYTGQNADGSSELFLWDEANGFTQLTFTQPENAVGIVMPSMSDNGQVISFVSNYGGTNTRLPYYYLNLWQQGTGITRIVPFAVQSSGLGTLASVSGDGNRVAFISDANPLGQNADNNMELFLWRRNAPLQQLTQTTGDHMYPAETILDTNYNGTRIGFYSSSNLTGQNPLQQMQYFLWDSVTGIRQLTSNHDSPPYMSLVTMNSQGDRIVGFGDGDWQTGMNPDAGDEVFYWTENVGWTQVTSIIGFNDSLFGDISGDGQTIVYTFYEGTGGTNEFFIAECPPVPTPPLAPSAPTAGAVTDTSITLNWQDNSTGETAFYIERSDDGNNWTQIGTTDGNIATFVDTDVACSTDYRYRVRAYNAELNVYSPFSPVTIISSGDCPPLVVPTLTLDTVTENEAAMTIANVDALATAIYVEFSASDNPYRWLQLAVLEPSATTHTDTTLQCERIRHYRVRVYRSNDEAFSQPSNVVTAMTPDCPPLAQPPAPTVLLTNRTVVQLSIAADTSGQVNNIYLQRSTNGVDWQTVTTFGAAGGSTVNSNLVCETDYYYRVQTYRQHDNELSLPSDSVMTMTTACPIPFESTVGLYRNGLWIFTDTNATGMPDIQFRFGPQQAGWMPIVGDWDGDGDDGIGVYRNGTFVLRNTTNAGMQDSLVYFGMREAGWQPIVGDWNGDGRDTVGVYKAGQFMLTNDHATSSLDHRFTWNTAGLTWQAIAGDWDASGADSIGLYHAGTFLLSNALDNSTPQRFSFGPTQSGWTPIAGDWNTDGTDTIGVYSQSIWRLRNSNNAGNVDTGFNFGARETGWYPIASYRGGVAPLLALSQAANVSFDASLEPTVEVTTVATEPPVVEITPEVTVEVTTEITATNEIAITPEVTAEVTVMPTETPVAAEPTVASPEPTALPTETPLPEVTDSSPEVTEGASAP